MPGPYLFQSEWGSFPVGETNFVVPEDLKAREDIDPALKDPAQKAWLYRRLAVASIFVE